MFFYDTIRGRLFKIFEFLGVKRIMGEEKVNGKEACNGSIMRACKILELFDAETPSWSLKDIAEACDLSSTTVMPVLRSLELNGFVDRDPKTKKYSLGMKFVEMGQKKVNSIDITQISSKYLNAISKKFLINTHIGVLFQGEVMYLGRHQAITHSLATSYVGKRIPAYCSAMGKAMLAYIDVDPLEIIRSGSLYSFTPYTHTNLDVIAEDIEKTRERGYSIDDEEYQMGGYCIGVPIFNAYGKVCAAISGSIVKTEENMKKADELIEALIEAGEKISAEMGYKPKKKKGQAKG